jgi:pimeloyl-ACP methyl ester carboxylesterase
VTPSARSFSALLAFVLLPGCAGLGARVEVQRPSEAPPAPVRGVVFCADGAGGFGDTSRALSQAVADTGVPLHVHALDWSHGCGRVISDQVDWPHVQAEGRRLAALVADWRARRPDLPVYLVGHSAGSGVVLVAAAQLPTGSVERIVLLAPAVSADYDLRPALACARGGIDVFYSGRDWASLGLGVAIVGTTDRRWTAAAGRVGFRPVLVCPGDAALYAKLRQHAWHPGLAWSGHHGGHYDGHRPAHLRAYVLPLLPPAPAG